MPQQPNVAIQKLWFRPHRAQKLRVRMRQEHLGKSRTDDDVSADTMLRCELAKTL